MNGRKIIIVIIIVIKSVYHVQDCILPNLQMLFKSTFSFFCFIHVSSSKISKKTYADIVRICKMLPECHIVCCGTLIYI